MQSSYPSFGFQGNPPSKLGFVCKPDMPPHINILFRARPPLETLIPPQKDKCRKYDGVNAYIDAKSLFEKTEPPVYVPAETKNVIKLKHLIENVEKNRLENKEKLRTCKYILSI
jgi:hypothetical protein